MEFRKGPRLPPALMSRPQKLTAYSCLDGIKRQSPYEVSFQLASLGFPKRALVSSSVANVEMTFGDAQEIS
jgi:hypothetical protein